MIQSLPSESKQTASNHLTTDTRRSRTFVKRDLKTLRYVIENDDGVLHIASER